MIKNYLDNFLNSDEVKTNSYGKKPTEERKWFKKLVMGGVATVMIFNMATPALAGITADNIDYKAPTAYEQIDYNNPSSENILDKFNNNFDLEHNNEAIYVKTFSQDKDMEAVIKFTRDDVFIGFNNSMDSLDLLKTKDVLNNDVMEWKSFSESYKNANNVDLMQKEISVLKNKNFHVSEEFKEIIKNNNIETRADNEDAKIEMYFNKFEDSFNISPKNNKAFIEYSKIKNIMLEHKELKSEYIISKILENSNKSNVEEIYKEINSAIYLGKNDNISKESKDIINLMSKDIDLKNPSLNEHRAMYYNAKDTYLGYIFKGLNTAFNKDMSFKKESYDFLNDKEEVENRLYTGLNNIGKTKLDVYEQIDEFNSFNTIIQKKDGSVTSFFNGYMVSVYDKDGNLLKLNEGYADLMERTYGKDIRNQMIKEYQGNNVINITPKSYKESVEEDPTGLYSPTDILNGKVST